MPFSRPKQLRSQEKWDRMLSSLKELLETKSFTAITVIQLAEASKISPAWIYTRIEGKEDLIQFLIEDYFESELSSAIGFIESRDWGEDTLEDRLRALINRWGEIIQENSGTIRLIRKKIERGNKQRPFENWIPILNPWFLECADEINPAQWDNGIENCLKEIGSVLLETSLADQSSRKVFVLKGAIAYLNSNE